MFHILWSLSNFSQVLFFRGTRLYWNLTPTTKNFGFPTAYCVKKKRLPEKKPVAGSQKVSIHKRKNGSEKIRGVLKKGPHSFIFFPQLPRCLRLLPHTAFLTHTLFIHSPASLSAWTMQHSIDFPRDRLPVSLFKTKPRYEYGLFNDFYTPKTSLRTSLWLITNFINSIGVHWSNKNFP